MKRGLFVAVLFVIPALALGADDAVRKADAVRIINDPQVNFTVPAADLFSSLQKCAGRTFDVAVQTRHDLASSYTVSVLNGGKVVYSFSAWLGTPFFVNDQKKRLYYAVFSGGGSGGEIVAVDLTTGKELWRSALQALGGVEHSEYSNRISMDGVNEVVILGNEAYGDYVEIKNCDTGQTLANRVTVDRRGKK